MPSTIIMIMAVMKVRRHHGSRCDGNAPTITEVRSLMTFFSASNAENMTYIHELPDWPNFTWTEEPLVAPPAEVRHRQGRLIGRMTLGFEFRAEASLRSLTEEVVKSSEIEGEILDREQVRSSLARRLGMDIGGLVPADRDVEGVVEMMLDATQDYAAQAGR
jgi:Fic family protein